MSRSLKVLVLFDGANAPPRGHQFVEELARPDWACEDHVVKGLRALGHEVRMLMVADDIRPLVEEITENRPDVAFNLLEQFNSNPSLVPNVVCLLEMMGVPYTGSNPLALRLCKDKALTKIVLTQCGVPNPPFQIFDPGKAIKRQEWLELPVVVKPTLEDASYGIARASVAATDEAFVERVKYLHEKTGQTVIAERYIEGRELYGSLLGNSRVRFFPLREVKFGTLGDKGPAIATFHVKWSEEYRKKWGIEYGFAEGVSDALTRRIEEMCKAALRALHITGYTRIDLRLDIEGEPTILEVNPNPNLAMDEDFAQSALKAGVSWEKLLQSILDLALRADADAA